ncbi:hypothetical protein [Methanofollis fontis]|uniref:Uncharacterized protein n=1 Tax=Methanofollis fontis TaxID=2052832 RepID=A0A483CWU0_9EURY|nr:hypothetical protein [Methanofollis fontis]TAJ43413.1 hypothetical protein CUJ86_11185 [Methanofollis fontis]
MNEGCAGAAEKFCAGVREALKDAEEYGSALREDRRAGVGERAVITVSVGVILVLLFALPDFFMFWIVASFLLYMVNPFMMFIPSGGAGPALPQRSEITEYIGKLKEIGAIKGAVTSNTSGIIEIVWNLFFINSQPLAPGFWLIYSIDILFALFRAITGKFDLMITLIIAVQSIAIILFYAVIWGMKPYSPGFFRNVIDIRQDVKEGIQGGIRSTVTILAFIGVGAAIAGTLVIAAMLLPGMTLNTLMDFENITLFKSLLPIVPILLAQLIIVRTLQGRASRLLLTDVNQTRVSALRERILPAAERIARSSREDGDEYCAQLEDLENEFMRLSVYRPESHRIGGGFTVYMIVPNLRLILRQKGNKRAGQ